MKRRSIGERLARAKSASVKDEIVKDWAENFNNSCQSYLKGMAVAFLAQDKGKYFDLADLLKVEIIKRSSAIPRIISECASTAAQQDTAPQKDMPDLPTPPSKSLDWDMVAEELGKTSDIELAHKLGCSHTAVAKERKRRGIPPASSKKRVDWSQWIHLLGQVSDAELAREIGCDRGTISAKRSGLGIPAYQAQDHSGEVDWSIWDRSLGTMTDEGIARLAGCDRKTVSDRRRKIKGV